MSLFSVCQAVCSFVLDIFGAFVPFLIGQEKGGKGGKRGNEMQRRATG